MERLNAIPDQKAKVSSSSTHARACSSFNPGISAAPATSLAGIRSWPAPAPVVRFRGLLDGAIGREQMMAHLADGGGRDLPLSADLENGFGDSRTVAETIRLAAATGIVGGSIEDASGRRGS